jgi:hypothetical protein
VWLYFKEYPPYAELSPPETLPKCLLGVWVTYDPRLSTVRI